jgi:hypothetical protein
MRIADGTEGNATGVEGNDTQTQHGGARANTDWMLGSWRPLKRKKVMPAGDVSRGPACAQAAQQPDARTAPLTGRERVLEVIR